ncbi:hypothetical protein [Mycobacteroides chelonae]|uniref:hypothetical protein n=1 Tax=Mycobacteroides chelonae TaxID=1774 RepID=UPI003567173B
MNLFNWIEARLSGSESPAPVVADEPPPTPLDPSPVPTAPVTSGPANETAGPVHQFGTQYRVRRDAADVIAGRLGPAGLARRIGDVGGLGSRPNTARDAMVRRAGFGEVIFDDDD